jgi:hypothetical protein
MYWLRNEVKYSGNLGRSEWIACLDDEGMKMDEAT